MKFSICVPNYNYEDYIGATIESVRNQEHGNWELRVSDNASTDGSVEVVKNFGDPRISVHVNRWNVGFAGNLDRACLGATGDRMLLLSSDDLMQPNALDVYARLADALGTAADRAVFFSLTETIDGQGRVIGSRDGDPKFWGSISPDEELSRKLGVKIRRVPAAALLRSSLQLLRVPATFVSTCYPRDLYEAVEGFGAGRLYGPDKFFCWKLLTVAEEAFLVNAPLFRYRIHANNQDGVQARQGALKHLVDQYTNSFDLPPRMLEVAGLTVDEVAAAFVEHDIALRGLQMLAQGKRNLARRTLSFGRAAYPALMRSNRKVAALAGLLAMGRTGEALAKRLYRRRHDRWLAEQSRKLPAGVGAMAAAPRATMGAA